MLAPPPEFVASLAGPVVEGQMEALITAFQAGGCPAVAATLATVLGRAEGGPAHITHRNWSAAVAAHGSPIVTAARRGVTINWPGAIGGLSASVVEKLTTGFAGAEADARRFEHDLAEAVGSRAINCALKRAKKAVTTEGAEFTAKLGVLLGVAGAKKRDADVASLRVLAPDVLLAVLALQGAVRTGVLTSST